GEALKELQEHIALLQDTEKTWGGDGKPRDAWKEKALELLKKPELIGITLDNQLNVSSSLCDVIVNRYNYLILQANAQRNKESVEALKELKKYFLGKMQIGIVSVYAELLYVPQAFWNAQTTTIDKQWQNDILQFMCYIMRFDPSDEKVKKLQQAINVVITT